MMPANTGSSKNMGWGSASRMAPWEEREENTSNVGKLGEPRHRGDRECGC